MEKEIRKVLKYFSIFAYHPTLDEIHTFLRVKISKKKLRYTPPEYSISKIKDQKSKIKNSEKKLSNWKFRAYLRLISLFPQIKLVGLSGSISMMNAEEGDDIDLFIITAKNKLFTGRFIALFLSQLLGLRRKRDSATHDKAWNESRQGGMVSSLSRINHKNKVCLNLFFDENNLKVPKFKQNLFVGHEVLQMKPLVVKDYIYNRFLEANLWVFRLFPNAKQIFNFQFSIFNKKSKIKNEKLSDWIEYKLKKFQLSLINKHKTSEIITSSQLWFHPDDFEKKIRL